jgi:hypothetical protein
MRKPIAYIVNTDFGLWLHEHRLEWPEILENYGSEELPRIYNHSTVYVPELDGTTRNFVKVY